MKRLQAGEFGDEFPGTARDIFSSPKRPDHLKDPPSLLFNGNSLPPPQEVESLRHETDHCPPSSAKVKNEWSYTSPLHTTSQSAPVRYAVHHPASLSSELHTMAYTADKCR